MKNFFIGSIALFVVFIFFLLATIVFLSLLISVGFSTGGDNLIHFFRILKYSLIEKGALIWIASIFFLAYIIVLPFKAKKIGWYIRKIL